MRIAALVLAYRYPTGLSALSRFFAADDIDMFVHVDAKLDDASFRAATNPDKTFFVEDPVSVYWGGFTMVEATIKLIEAALTRHYYDRYILISDDSLPLLNPSEIRERLEIHGDHVDAGPVKSDDMRLRYDRFYMFDSRATQARWQRPAEREITTDTFDRLLRLSALRQNGKKPVDTIYHGKQWMALAASSVERVIDSWKNDMWLRQSFEFSNVPDESYFHTILAQQECERRRFMHVEWTGTPPPRVFKGIDEISSVAQGGALFVRKVDLSPDDLELWVDRLLAT